MSNEWRRVIAALADPDRRAAYAAAVLGVDTGLPEKRRARAVAALQDAGVLDRDGAVAPALYTDLLAAEPEVRREGIERFILDGRIEQYPARPAVRTELLEWVAAQLPPGDLTEAAVNERLAGIVDDVASLRRYLVDAGLLDRTADGSEYRRR